MQTKEAIKEGLTIRELYVMQELNDSHDRTISSFKDEALVTAAALTGLVDKLEFKKLIKRVRCFEDRRKIYIKLTEKGKGFFRDY